jgi:methylene-tetrahydromethanopterin dehydrogenase
MRRRGARPREEEAVADRNILHMITPLKHVSPFDVNMALDAGYDAVVPYISVSLGEVPGLVQDAIFSRPPQRGVRTGIFIGGKDVVLALDMLEAAKTAQTPPFETSLFADPAGSFTTAAAMMTSVEKILKTKFDRGLRDLKLFVFGATGVIGFSAAVIAAMDGARVTLVGYDGVQRVANSATQIKSRFGVDVDFADGSTEESKSALARQAEAIICAGRAGVRILAAAQIAAAKDLLVVADANAVPPSGVEGLASSANATPIGGAAALGLGPFALGNTKYKIEFELFRRMTTASKVVCFDFRDAFALAREIHV